MSNQQREEGVVSTIEHKSPSEETTTVKWPDGLIAKVDKTTVRLEFNKIGFPYETNQTN